MMWPWSELATLRRQIEWLAHRDTHRLWVSALRETIALNAYRDLLAANKGIRRLNATLARYEPTREGEP